MCDLGSETKKALENFGPGTTPSPIIRALAETKLATFRAILETEPEIHQKINRMGETFSENIEAVLLGFISDPTQCKVPFGLHQGGAGTSLHMAIMESTLKKTNTPQLLDVLGKSQSTNDVIPTAFTIAIYREVQHLEENVIELQEKLVELELAHTNTLITGRTQLQDAIPMTLGQVFGGWAGAIARDRWRFHKVLERLRTIALGGTALGTGSGASAKYVYSAERHLREITGLPLSRSQNWVDEISNSDKYAEVSGVFQRLAENLIKISGDLLIYTSSAMDEIHHPQIQMASTFMPFKTNPVILEFVKGLSMDCIGEAHKVSQFTQSSTLQINPWLTFILESLMKMSTNLRKSTDALLDGFLEKMVVNKDTCEKNLFSSSAIWNSLRSRLDYSLLSKIYLLTIEKGIKDKEGLLELIAANSDINSKQISEWLSVEHLIRG